MITEGELKKLSLGFSFCSKTGRIFLRKEVKISDKLAYTIEICG